MALILEFGLEDQFAMQFVIGNRIFLAELKRKYLREAEKMLVRIYSRKTEVNFTLLGLVTQCGLPKASTGIGEEQEQEQSIKKLLMDDVENLANVESTFTGSTENEIIIDPIAIYRDLSVTR